MATELPGAVYLEHLVRVDVVNKFLRDLLIDPADAREVRVEAGVPVKVYVTGRDGEEREV